MRIGQDVLFNLDAAINREWLVANGVGGSASGTVAGANTRRTHGLLTAAGPHGLLQTLLLKVDERLRSDAGSFDLSLNLFATGQRPAAALPIEEFGLEPWPVWRYRLGEVLLEKSIFMVHGHNAVAVTYRHLGGPPATLSVSPFVVARDPQSLEREDPGLGTAVQGIPGRVRIGTRAGFPALTLWHNGVFMPARVWQRQLHYPLDVEAARRGEDALVPGHFKTPLSEGGALHIVASSEDDLFRALAAEERLGVPPPRTLAECVAAIEAGERERLDGWRQAALEGADFTARQAATAHGGDNESLARRREPLVDEHDPLVIPLAEGLVTGLAWRGPRLTVLESLPSGIERGESALRAVPGLVAIRAFDAARQVLSGYLDFLDEGVAPSSFDPVDGHPLYGDPAPSLWLIHATDLYVRRSGETELLADRLFQPLESIMQSFRQGTRHGITVDRDGLLATGAGGELLKRSDHNALWYHALVAMAQLARLIGRKESGAFYLAWAREHQKQFNDELWDEKHGCLYEALGPRGPVVGLSPSQLLAASLPPAVLQPDLAERLVATIEKALVTPLGLREAPGSDRVSAAWMGPFITAVLRARRRAPDAHRQAQEWMLGLWRRADLFLGRLPAAFAAGTGGATDADARAGDFATIAPGADPTSILAAAELLRVWIEEMDRSQLASEAGAPA
jgi:glycogen debranching enzyme